MAITLFTGEPGSGKIYMMTKMALAKLECQTRVFSNYRIHWTGLNLIGFTNFEFFKVAKKGLVLIDEIHIYLDARRWFDMPDWVKKKLNQHRHDSLDIYGTCQWFGQVDKAVRELATEIIDCEKKKFFKWYFVKTTLWKRKKTGLKSKFRPTKTRWHYLSPKIFARYNTMEVINHGVKPDQEVISRH